MPNDDGSLIKLDGVHKWFGNTTCSRAWIWRSTRDR